MSVLWLQGCPADRNQQCPCTGPPGQWEDHSSGGCLRPPWPPLTEGEGTWRVEPQLLASSLQPGFSLAPSPLSALATSLTPTPQPSRPVGQPYSRYAQLLRDAFKEGVSRFGWAAQGMRLRQRRGRTWPAFPCAPVSALQREMACTFFCLLLPLLLPQSCLPLAHKPIGSLSPGALLQPLCRRQRQRGCGDKTAGHLLSGPAVPACGSVADSSPSSGLGPRRAR